MIIAITGSVGVGKTTIAKYIAEYFSCENLSLNEYAEKYKLKEVPEIQTFDFDIDSLLDDLEKEIKERSLKGDSLVVESHFSHFINPKFIDILIVINRDISELKKEYLKRGYNEEKIEDNLEVETFDLCFFEAEEEGYMPKQIIKIENDEDIEELKKRILKKIEVKFKK